MNRIQRQPLSTIDIVVMLVCGIVGGAAVLGFVLGGLFALYVAVLPDNPMTGLGFVSAVLLSAVSAVVAAIVLPGAAPPGWRAKAYGLASAIFGVLVLLAWAALTIAA